MHNQLDAPTVEQLMHDIAQVIQPYGWTLQKLNLSEASTQESAAQNPQKPSSNAGSNALEGCSEHPEKEEEAAIFDIGRFRANLTRLTKKP